MRPLEQPSLAYSGLQFPYISSGSLGARTWQNNPPSQSKNPFLLSPFHPIPFSLLTNTLIWGGHWE